MGRRTGRGTPPAEPLPRKKQRTLLGSIVRVAAIVVAVLAVLIAVSGFYFSGVLADGALVPPRSTEPVYDLEVVGVNPPGIISIKGSADDDRLGRVGVEGIEWDGGYVQSPEIAATKRVDGDRIDDRVVDPDADLPPYKSMVALDPFAYDGDPLSALGIDFEEVVYSSDVGNFPAWFIPGSKDTWVIIVHGKGASREEGLRAIPVLSDLGYPIMVISYRNDVGEIRDPSGYHRYGETEWVDLAAAVAYAQENGAKEHILFGYSMGGAIVTSYLTQSPLRNFTKAAILDSPVLDFEAAVDFQASQRNLPLLPVKIPGVVTQVAKWIASWRYDVDWDATDYLSQTANIHAPMLIFHGTDDTSVPYATSAELAERRPDIVTLVTTRAGHTRSWNVDPDAYESAIREFLTGLD